MQAPATGPGHVVLLGDSVFDNAAYVAGGPDVVRQLRSALPHDWRATLVAVDGATVSSLPSQMRRIPADASHLVVSVGGNDALRDEGTLHGPARSVAEGLMRLAAIRDRFAAAYRDMLDGLLATGLPVAACTIYDPRFVDRLRQDLAVAGLALFNDAILRAAFTRGLPVLDLRLVCDEDADYANPIEPSVQGGAKIAAVIARMVAASPQARGVSAVFAGKG